MKLYSIRKDRSVEIPVIFNVDPDAFHDIGPAIEADEEYLNEMIKMGLRARMDTQSFVTGQNMINIDFYPDTK